MAASSAALDYPSSGEYNVLVQRFKLLNLVQRVAHRDVSEMLDTVGLESLAQKGTLSRWGWSGDGADGGEGSAGGRSRGAALPHYTGYGKYTAERGAQAQHRRAAATSSTSRRTPPLRPVSPAPPRMSFGRSTSGFEAQIAAARWNSGVEEDSEEASRQYGVTRRLDTATAASNLERNRDSTRRRYVVRRPQRVLRSSPEDRDAFFTRLAEPRERPGPVVEDVLIYDPAPARQTRRNGGGGADGRDGYRMQDDPRSEAYDYAGLVSHHHQQQPRRYPPPLPHFAQGNAPFDGRPYSTAGDLRAHYHGPVPAPLPPSYQDGAGRYDTDFPSARDERRYSGGEDGLPAALPPPPPQQHRGNFHAEEREPHDVDFTPPPTRPGPYARGAAGAVASSGDGPVRRRSVNFALGEDGEEDNAFGRSLSTPTAAAAALPLPPLQPPQDRRVTSPTSASAEELFAASAPAALHARATAPQDGSPAVPQLRFPPSAGPGSFYGDGEDPAGGAAAAALNVPGSGRGGAPSSAANSPGGLRGRSASNVSGFPKSPRVGRGLAPKAKPKGAMDEASVPVEAVRHAAALVTRSGSTPASGASPATSTPGNSYAAPHATSARTPPVVSAYSGGGILLSPRPNSMNAVADRRPAPAGETKAAAFPAAPLSPQDVQLPAVLSPTSPVAAAVPVTAVAARAPFPSSVPTSSAVAAGASVATPVNAGAQQSFQEVSSKVNHMLQNLQHMLHRVFKDGDAVSTKAGAGADGKAHATSTEDGDAYGSSFEDASEQSGAKAGDGQIVVDLDSDDDYNVYGDEEDQEEDEMLLYTRIQHKVSQLGAEMKHVTLPSTNSNSSSNSSSNVSGNRGGDGAATREAAARASEAMTDSASKGMTSAQVGQRSSTQPRRARGEVPDAVVQRLCAYRMEHFQYIAYNERLWNTSTTSQFVFAQRLTAALLEECWAEVMAEVDANMSEYVEGLVDHELQ